VSTGGQDLAGRVAIVTGASSGIGRAVAVALAGCGASVAVGYRGNAAGAEETLEMARAGGGGGIAVQADLREPAAIDRLFGDALARFGRLDILVNNAGDPVASAPFGEWTIEMLDQVLAVNLRAVWLCAQAALVPMREAGYGRIVNVSSIGAVTGGSPGTLPYAATKGAIETFTRGLAHVVGRDGITVNAVAPGSIDTPMQGYVSPEYVERMAADSAVGRTGLPCEVAGAVLYLASDAAAYVTGQVIRVDGGRRY
jgi:3-oxoacyl-[acyl-carrier protein] reductase